MRKEHVLSSIIYRGWTVGMFFSLVNLMNPNEIKLANANIELVQSVPIETTLEIPGIRHTQEAWINLIRSAQRSIDLEQFYLTNRPGEALTSVLDELRAAATRGVKIRILLDAKFYKNYSFDPLSLNQSPNIEVKTILLADGVQHAKFFLVDEFSAYLGSANFDWLALTHIHEIGLRIEDPRVAKDLGRIFEMDWQTSIPLASPHQPHPDLLSDSQPSSTSHSSLSLSDDRGVDSSNPIQVLASPFSRSLAGIPQTLDAILMLLNSAQSKIRIQVYQYTTRDPHGSTEHWGELDSAIRAAGRRGVQVQLLVDRVALKTGQTGLTALAELENIEVRTVKIPEWSGGHLDFARLIHSKYLTIDGHSGWVGSENWSQNYFMTSRNVGVLFRVSDLVDRLDQVFDRVWSSPYASKQVEP